MKWDEETENRVSVRSARLVLHVQLTTAIRVLLCIAAGSALLPFAVQLLVRNCTCW